MENIENSHEFCKHLKSIARQISTMTTLYFWGKDITNKTFTNQITETISQTEFQQQLQEVSCGSEHFVIRTNEKLYVGGDNSKGQLGLVKHSYESVEMKQLNLQTFLPSLKVRIISVSCGWHHSLLLSQLGEVYSSGEGKQGALGVGEGQNSYSFALVMKGIVKISAGRDHSLALSKTKAYGWGNSKDGQLGLISKRIYYTPKELNVYPTTSVLAGNKFSFFITSKGVFATGLNHQAQLGLGHEDTVFTPKRLQIEDEVTKIIGANYCIAITKNKEGIIWGLGCFGQFLFPTKLEFLNDVEDAAVSSTFGVIKNSNGKIFVWGSNKDGELGLPDRLGKDYVFQNQVLSELQLNSFKCGNSFTIGWTNQPSFGIQNKSRNSEQIKNTKYQQQVSNHYRQSSIQFMHLGTSKPISEQESFKLKESDSRLTGKKSDQLVHITEQSESYRELVSDDRNSTIKASQARKNITYCQKINETEKKIFPQSNQEKENSEFQRLKIQNQMLLQQNMLLRRQLEQQSLKDRLNGLSNLKEKYEYLTVQNDNKAAYIAKIREQYLALLDIVENNRFLTRVFDIERTNFCESSKKLYNEGSQLSKPYGDQFQRQLKYLRDILENASQG